MYTGRIEAAVAVQQAMAMVLREVLIVDLDARQRAWARQRRVDDDRRRQQAEPVVERGGAARHRPHRMHAGVLAAEQQQERPGRHRGQWRLAQVTRQVGAANRRQQRHAEQHHGREPGRHTQAAVGGNQPA